MNQYKHLLALDLTCYGAALAIINEFVDDEGIKVFEVSPCGQSAILILVAKESVSLQVIKAEATSIFKAEILSAVVIENIHEELLPTYLSQNNVALSKSLVILECSSVATGLRSADKLLKDKHTIADFRIIRTFPKNVILTISGENVGELSSFVNPGVKKTYIENVRSSLRSFYEI